MFRSFDHHQEFLAIITLINISFDIPILKLAMWQHVVLCVLSFALRTLLNYCCVVRILLDTYRIQGLEERTTDQFFILVTYSEIKIDKTCLYIVSLEQFNVD